MGMGKTKYRVAAAIITIIIIILTGCTARGAENKYQDVTGAESAGTSEKNEEDKKDKKDQRSGFGEINDPKARRPTPEEAEKYPLITNLPALYITTEYKMSKITKEQYLAAKYTLVYEDGSGIYDQPLLIKGRGNYQWGMPKKPYTIKLLKDTSLLGMKSAGKWNILGEYIDKTLLRNYLTFWLASAAGLEHTPECRFVDAVFNGKYNGNYLITESVQIHENRIDINKYSEALFEIEAIYRHEDHEYCIEMIDGYIHIMYKKPEEEDLYYGQKQKNLEKFRDFFGKLDKSLGEGYDSYSKYIDVESFVNWYVVNEFCKNFDSNFTSSCYCYLKDGRLYMGPVWDYHTCYGSQNVATCMDPRGFHVNGSPWYGRLTQDETFARLVRERWTRLRADGVLEDFVKNLYDTAGYISESRIKNFELWPGSLKDSGLRGNKSRYTYEGEEDYLTDWIAKRLDWIDAQWLDK